MTLKTLLLGSATALVTAGGAQAADLSVPEPVEYVRVCDAFGAGYWYAPGTDTCIRIGGYVRFQIDLDGDDQSTFIDDDETGVGEEHPTLDDDHRFRTRAQVNLTAKSMTEYGPLTGYIVLLSDWSGAQDPNDLPGGFPSHTDDNDRLITLDEAFIELGPLLVGMTSSAYDYGGGYTYTGGYRSDEAQTDQIRLSWALNGFGIILAAEDYRDRKDGYGDGTIPDLVAAITASWGDLDVKASFGYGQRAEIDVDPGPGVFLTDDDTWGAQIGASLRLNWIAQGDVLRGVVGYSQGAGDWVSAPYNPLTGDYWSFLVSFRHYWQSNLYSAITGSWVDGDGGFGAYVDPWRVSFNTVYEPVKNFQIGGEISYDSNNVIDATDGNWWGLIRVQRNIP